MIQRLCHLQQLGQHLGMLEASCCLADSVQDAELERLVCLAHECYEGLQGSLRCYVKMAF